MIVESVKITDLIPDPSNARKHDPKNLDAIKGSLAKFGQQKPIVVSGAGVVLAGNGTLEAAKALGWDKIDIVRTGLEGSEAIAYAIADNRTGELAAWNDDVLSRTLRGLKDDGVDLGAIGFDQEDLVKWLKTAEVVAPGCDEDEVPEVTDTRCKVGDLWQLGNHRLLCGDSTNVQHVDRLMGGEKADMVFTDPPYGVSAVEKSSSLKSLGYRVIENDQSIDVAVASFGIAQLLSDNLIFWGGNYYAHKLPEAGSWIVWRKKENDSDQHDFEVAWLSTKKKMACFSHKWSGWWRDSEKGEQRSHPTQKPIALAEWCFDNYGKPKSVLDLFLGSGSTLIACEKTNRRCFGMEIDPHYCDVILARWEKFTGKTANLTAG